MGLGPLLNTVPGLWASGLVSATGTIKCRAHQSFQWYSGAIRASLAVLKELFSVGGQIEDFVHARHKPFESFCTSQSSRFIYHKMVSNHFYLVRHELHTSNMGVMHLESLQIQ